MYLAKPPTELSALPRFLPSILAEEVIRVKTKRPRVLRILRLFL